MKTIHIIIISVVVLACITAGVCLYSIYRHRLVYQVWKARCENINVGMTRNQVYAILGFEPRSPKGGSSAVDHGLLYVKLPNIGGDEFTPVPDRALPSTASEERYFFKNGWYLVVFMSKTGLSMNILFSDSGSVVGKELKKRNEDAAMSNKAASAD